MLDWNRFCLFAFNQICFEILVKKNLVWQRSWYIWNELTEMSYIKKLLMQNERKEVENKILTLDRYDMIVANEAREKEIFSEKRKRTVEFQLNDSSVIEMI